MFKRCHEHNITLGNGKVQAGTEIQFGAYVVNDYGYKPDPSKVQAIQDFPKPEDLTNLMSFIGLASQFNDFSPDLKHAMEPLKGLLSQMNTWIWNQDHSKAMTDVKDIIISPQCQAHFDPSRPIVLTTDASRIGLGFILIQPDANDPAFDGNGSVITTPATSYTLKKAPKGGLIVCGSRFI